MADRLIDEFASTATGIIDPFCGSGAILTAATQRGIAATGLDINPFAIILSSVKLHGFDASEANNLTLKWIAAAERARQPLAINWPEKCYWFTPQTLNKYERLRAVADRFPLTRTREGMAALLAYLLSIRLCSRADQRSPKPFISAGARNTRAGRHFDPYRLIISLLDELAELHRNGTRGDGRVIRCDVASLRGSTAKVGKHSHAITSPPYINAQDYFRNFKLELYLIEGVASFCVDSLRERFIGTERGDLLSEVPVGTLKANREIVRGLRTIEAVNPRLAAVVHRYCFDMGLALDCVKKHLKKDGKLILVCGDNLVAGVRIATWRVLQRLAETRDFKLYDRFSDEIGDRLLPPKRAGHRGLIKQEVVSAYRL